MEDILKFYHHHLFSTMPHYCNLALGFLYCATYILECNLVITVLSSFPCGYMYIVNSFILDFQLNPDCYQCYEFNY